MRGASLFVVLVLAKCLSLWGQGIPLSPGVPFIYFWQDALFSIGFVLLETAFPVKRGLVLIYWSLVFFAAINVPVTRVLSTSLTWPILRAAGGPLSDSIVLYLTVSNIALMGIVLLAGGLVPKILERGSGHRRAATVTLAAIGLGGFCSSHLLETRGLHRNVWVTLAITALPRIGAMQGDENWRASPFADGTGRDSRLLQYQGAGKGKHVLFVILESTGAQYLGVYGASPDPMPHLTQLAGRGIVIESAYSVYPESIKGLFGTLCSTYPAFDSLPEKYVGYGAPSIAQALQTAGYRTAMFHSGRFAYLGMESIVRNRGFQLLEDAGDISGEHQSSFGIDDERLTVRRIFKWIDSLKSTERFFVNFLPIAGHHPYSSPQPWLFPRGDDLGRYQNALHHADEALGDLVKGLEERRLLEETVIVVIGDHGEAFGQHTGNYAHTLHIYEENIRVPFVVAIPGIKQGLRFDRRASLLDVAPTILDVVGLVPSADYQGSSVLDGEDRMSLFFTDYAQGLLGLRDGPWKFIWEVETRRSKLFDLSRDPGEVDDQSANQQARVSAYSALLLRWSSAQKHRLFSPSSVFDAKHHK